MMDIHPERSYPEEPENRPRLIVPALIWLCTIAAVIVIALQLSGCAQTTFQGLCALQPAGMTDSGVAVFHTYCEAQS